MVANGNRRWGSRPIKARYLATGTEGFCETDARAVGATTDATGVLAGSSFPQEGDLAWADSAMTPRRAWPDGIRKNLPKYLSCQCEHCSSEPVQAGTLVMDAGRAFSWLQSSG
jgi:hypothetical protein